LLVILTVCDIRAVGPGVWNGWKGQLLRTLYHETQNFLTGGQSNVSQTRRVAAAKEELAGRLAGWSEAARGAYMKRHYDNYWLRADIEQQVAHAELIARADRDREAVAVDHVMKAFEGVTEITVFAPDHPRLLSIIGGACTVAGANIVSAQIFTTRTGQALDSIAVRCEQDNEDDEARRAVRIGDLIRRALAGELRLPDVVKAKKRPARVRAFSLEPEIAVENDWSDLFTVIETSGLDRPGLLYDLTSEISALNLNIGSAHVGTFGERAVDVFYVTDLTGDKVDNGARKAAIRRRLTAAFAGERAAPAGGAGRKNITA